MKFLTESEVRDMAKEVVAEIGEDYIYNPGQTRNTCVYVEGYVRDEDGYDTTNAVPSCLWGHVFIKNGIATADWFVKTGANEVEIEEMVMDLDDTSFTEEALTFMGLSQQYQDRGFSWSEAIDKATARLAPPRRWK
jgi:hypothetical protein